MDGFPLIHIHRAAVKADTRGAGRRDEDERPLHLLLVVALSPRFNSTKFPQVVVSSEQ